MPRSAPSSLHTPEVLQILSSLRNELKERYSVIRIRVFGSFARRTERPDSDVDVLVELADPTFDNYMDCKFRLEEALSHPVDLVLADTVKPRARRLVEQDVLYV